MAAAPAATFLLPLGVNGAELFAPGCAPCVPVGMPGSVTPGGYSVSRLGGSLLYCVGSSLGRFDGGVAVVFSPGALQCAAAAAPLRAEPSRASAVRSEQASCARTSAKSSPAQVPRHEVASLQEKSPVPGSGHGGRCIPFSAGAAPAAQVSVRDLARCHGWAARRREPAASVEAALGGSSLGSRRTPSPASR